MDESNLIDTLANIQLSLNLVALKISNKIQTK